MAQEPENSAGGRHQKRNFCYLFILLVLIWLALTSSLDRQELAVGFLVSLLIAFFLSRTYRELELPPPGIRRLFFSGVYIAVLVREIIRANLDVAWRVLQPRMPIKPGVVIIRTGLKSSLARMILANSITLTPGTFALDIIGDKILIHWINVRTEDTEKATGIIGGKFEKYLKEIFE
jgi:multicomponent Na+:H+ antiporter subunit E